MVMVYNVKSTASIYDTVDLRLYPKGNINQKIKSIIEITIFLLSI